MLRTLRVHPLSLPLARVFFRLFLFIMRAVVVEVPQCRKECGFCIFSFLGCHIFLLLSNKAWACQECFSGDAPSLFVPERVERWYVHVYVASLLSLPLDLVKNFLEVVCP